MLAILALIVHLRCCRHILASGFYFELIQLHYGSTSRMWITFLDSIA
jgi:hypothetical protein